MEKAKKALFMLLALILFSCAGRPALREGEESIAGKAEELLPPVAEPSGADYLTIVAAGDNIIHDPILKACFNDGVYSFDSIYDHIRSYITSADIAFVNQETVLGNSSLGFSGYPLFSTPPEAGAALASAGFTIVNHATNHAMDKGEAGLLSSMEFWNSRNVPYLGIHRCEEDRLNNPVIIGKNNIRVGFLAYTYGTNNIPLPKDKPYLLSLAEPEKMSAEIDALRPLCDYLVVSMHWGEEYRQEASKSQESFAALLAEHRVDLVIGHHPHVLEAMAIVQRPDGMPMTVFYSLGNFLSAHARPEKEALLGGIMYVKLKKTGEGITTEEAGLIPIITHYDADQAGFSIYPLSEYSGELAEKHWKRVHDRDMTLDYFNKKALDLFGPALIMENPFMR